MATTSARPPKSLAALVLPGGTIGSRAAVRKRHALTLFGAAHSERKKHAARSPALRWHRWTALVFLPAVSPCTTRLGAGAFLRERRATRFFRKPRRPRGNQNGLVEKESVAREGEEGGRRGEGVMGGAACSTRGFVKSRADSPLLLPPPSRRARARALYLSRWVPSTAAGSFRDCRAVILLLHICLASSSDVRLWSRQMTTATTTLCLLRKSTIYAYERAVTAAAPRVCTDTRQSWTPKRAENSARGA